MKKLLILTTLTGALASQALAFEVDITRTAGYYTIPGGEFTVSAVTPSSEFDAIYKNYASVATLGGGFQTFCLSLTTGLLGNPQDASLSDSGVASGSSYLYSQFARGSLAGYNYTPGVGREASSMLLQAAIWYFQGSTQAQIDGYTDFATFDPATDPFVVAAEGALGGLLGARAVSTGTGVDQLVLTSLTGEPSQPMLALVPDGASTIMLLGFALSGIGLVSRKLRA